MIKIHGLTQGQIEMLDIIWSFDEPRDLQNFIETLDEREQLEYNTLSRLVIMAVIDQHTEKMTDFPEALNIIKRVM
jgi:transcriptional regulator of NAD metabolism